MGVQEWEPCEFETSEAQKRNYEKKNQNKTKQNPQKFRDRERQSLGEADRQTNKHVDLCWLDS